MRGKIIIFALAILFAGSVAVGAEEAVKKERVLKPSGKSVFDELAGGIQGLGDASKRAKAQSLRQKKCPHPTSAVHSCPMCRK